MPAARGRRGRGQFADGDELPSRFPARRQRPHEPPARDDIARGRARGSPARGPPP
ncbi:hypothetical protein FM112_01195 [Gulosibacter sp. 10]|nr:hypothetical protein FM112_01195 [Gulosibacter sp. 10]